MLVRTVDGAGVPAYADGIRRVYADVFPAPPWNEGPAAATSYTGRLATDAERSGFTAALAPDADTVTGFVTAWTTPAPLFPDARSYGQVAAALGPGGGFAALLPTRRPAPDRHTRPRQGGTCRAARAAASGRYPPSTEAYGYCFGGTDRGTGTAP